MEEEPQDGRSRTLGRRMKPEAVAALIVSAGAVVAALMGLFGDPLGRVAFIDVLLLIGIFCAALAADRIVRMRPQILGFVSCAVGLFLASFSLNLDGGPEMLLIFTGFMMFSFTTYLGPNAMTYLIVGEVFATHIRGKGAGFAVSFAKIGAVLTAFLFPILLKDIGTRAPLYILVGTSLLGGVITWIFGIETNGINLQKVGHE